jgi:hypothetical protein
MSTLFMNHELDNTTLSEPIVGGPKNRGAFVSQWILDADGDPIAGRRARRCSESYSTNTRHGHSRASADPRFLWVAFWVEALS